MYNIYVNQHPFVIAHEKDDYAQYAHLPAVKYTSPLKVLGLIEQMENGNLKGIVMLTDNTRHLFKIFEQFCEHIEAAGGVVYNKEKEILMIKRNGRWDLPKGKLDEGETLEEAAVREVEEECGINGLRITEKLLVTYHTYFIGQKRILKSTHWYSMVTDSRQQLVPQSEEGITEANWVSPVGLDIDQLDTFLSVKEILNTLKQRGATF